jgi:hypothetical protein
MADFHYSHSESVFVLTYHTNFSAENITVNVVV